MSETQEAKSNKAATVYEDVTMADGRVVKFPGKRQTDKTITIDEAAGTVSVRFDFRNGQTRELSSAELTPATMLRALGHGVAQKAGDEYSGVTEIDDMVIAVDEIFARLRAGDWSVAREAGDSTAGASIVIKAIMEATGKPVEFVKSFLQAKLDAAKAKGEKLSRQELYNAFRNPATPTGKIIKRLEEEKLAKATKVSGADLLAEMG